MTDLGGVSYLLGWTIERNRANRSIFIHQKSYATKVLDRFSMLDSNPKRIPIAQQLSVKDCPSDDEMKAHMTSKPYREAVGSFMYLMTGTRPDLAYFIREVSKFPANPGKPHWNAVKQGMHYLNGTIDHGITLGGNENLELLQCDEYIRTRTMPSARTLGAASVGTSRCFAIARSAGCHADTTVLCCLRHKRSTLPFVTVCKSLSTSSFCYEK
ncbi:hypothetical protein ON010_g9855 [Phytophthora cinnamomi]|nr:hypothetical protein ON010_g9855 [Phytophthora cinnamomi]